MNMWREKFGDCDGEVATRLKYELERLYKDER